MIENKNLILKLFHLIKTSYIFHLPDRAPIHAFQHSKIWVFLVEQAAYS